MSIVPEPTNQTQDQLYNLIQTNLQPGTTIKNYKTLCTLLSEDLKAGDSKKAQHKEWQRYFDYEKEGQRYIITEIYSQPLPKEDKRTLGNNSIYVQHIELILLNYLSKQEGFTATLTLKKLFLLMGMINPHYIEENKDIIKQQNDIINDYQINHFYQRTYQKLRKILFDTLRNLKNRCLIDYEEIVMINIKEPDINGILRTNIRPATDEEKKNILAIKKIVLKEMGLDSITLVHLKFKHREFYNRVNELLKEKYNINYIYNDIKILFTKEHIIEALAQAELNMQRITLNTKVINAVNEQAKHNLEKSQREYDQQVEEYLNHIIGRPSQMVLNKFFRLTEDVYLDAQFELSELLLRLK
jgi:hypothetical protein